MDFHPLGFPIFANGEGAYSVSMFVIFDARSFFHIVGECGGYVLFLPGQLVCESLACHIYLAMYFVRYRRHGPSTRFLFVRQVCVVYFASVVGGDLSYLQRD